MSKTDLVNYMLIFLSGEWLRKWGTDRVGRVARTISLANQLCLYSWRRYMQLYLLVSANGTISFPRLRVFAPETEDYFSGSRFSIQTYMCFVFPLIKFGMCTMWREGRTTCDRTESRPKTHPYFEHLSWFTAADYYIELPFILCSFFFFWKGCPGNSSYAYLSSYLNFYFWIFFKASSHCSMYTIFSRCEVLRLLLHCFLFRHIKAVCTRIWLCW